ncbi:hypothetical protein [Paenibacillus glycinis]|uniref:Uncharacterized protein n=1 Tax=Paenibacillus glycinis TaxID=2697035 RepID=A0ABW9XRR8_9BACL|nr:hypothetical protein [Paenibacillus glycinis]NBD25330.1 hypothetical protein [Paenibacillus glycinis]
MFELHDALLYALSICTLVSLAYLYLLGVPGAAAAGWTKAAEADFSPAEPQQPPGTVHARRQRLTRLTKRKEAPDDDSSPCASLLMPVA